MLVLWPFLMAAGLLLFVLVLIDVVRKDLKTVDKVLWLLLPLLLPVVGALIYLFLRKKIAGAPS